MDPIIQQIKNKFAITYEDILIKLDGAAYILELEPGQRVAMNFPDDSRVIWELGKPLEEQSVETLTKINEYI